MHHCMIAIRQQYICAILYVEYSIIIYSILYTTMAVNLRALALAPAVLSLLGRAPSAACSRPSIGGGRGSLPTVPPDGRSTCTLLLDRRFNRLHLLGLGGCCWRDALLYLCGVLLCRLRARLRGRRLRLERWQLRLRVPVPRHVPLRVELLLLLDDRFESGCHLMER